MQAHADSKERKTEATLSVFTTHTVFSVCFPNLLYDGLSSGHSLEFLVMFNHSLLTANERIKHLMNNPSSVTDCGHRGTVMRGLCL